ncbi:unnamed protein product [Pedinophyceae sp. YPF-701]|nr:unnamed protein product [Pedinophyceae sp. YPF-701]
MGGPNILITGTPGTGKTTLAELVASMTGLRHINVGQWVKDKELHQGWDQEHQSFIIDEDKVVDELEPLLGEGGNVVDHHGCDFFPERWFQLVVVLQTDNTELWGRLERRGYPEAKVKENVEAEIFMVVAEEASDSYKPEIVKYLRSDKVEEVEANAEWIAEWVAANS